jgi:FAD synthase
MATGAELTYQTNATALQMASAIFGDGVAITGTVAGVTIINAVNQPNLNIRNSNDACNAEMGGFAVLVPKNDTLPIFPVFDAETGVGYSPSAHRSLRRVEAQVQLTSGRAA